ncbi:hypothetical protein FHS19_006833 [Paenibacillus rhizosphaerae]|uniref:Rhamnogalacturonase A/B/Epimerase-like pectate lyase domain-containing protein n=1 Tax=Paenibacillus rhizosphaerae TaxID=297318 RepID=A0A839TYT8_9BACL|nr:glycosyl hydrolase family 28-related protein [Paenibacillus rhizosphaerae]MBB3132106.1 hypothetical protein [Paenibacillus rhizosphaerae]
MDLGKIAMALAAEIAAKPLQQAFVSPEDFGAKGDGVHDDTSGLRQAIQVAETTGKEVYLSPNKIYAFSDTLLINKPLTITGGGSWETFDNTDRPSSKPFLKGTILLMTASGKDAIRITVSAQSVNLKNFGILFDKQFVDTGHGINAIPPSVDDHYDHGLFSSVWENIKVAGHDGNHYAFHIVNPLYDTFINLRGYGGGILCFDNDSAGGWHYGNTVVMHPYGILMQGGSADGYRLKSTTDKLNFVTMIRPQVNVESMLPGLGGVSPTNAQHPVNGDWNTAQCTIIDGDFESGIGILDNWYGQMGWDVSEGGYLGFVREPFTDYVPTSGNRNKNEMGKGGHMLGSVTLNPTSTEAATLTISVGPDTSPENTTTILDMSIPAGAPAGQVLPYSFYVRAGWYYTITTTNATLGKLRNTNQRGWGLSKSG